MRQFIIFLIFIINYLIVLRRKSQKIIYFAIFDNFEYYLDLINYL